MIGLNMKYLDECNNYIIQLSSFLDKVCSVVVKNENSEVIKTYVGEFGNQFNELFKFIQSNNSLKELILKGELDLTFALESFGKAFHSNDYELCNEILKYEIKYILYKWQMKLKNLQ